MAEGVEGSGRRRLTNQARLRLRSTIINPHVTSGSSCGVELFVTYHSLSSYLYVDRSVLGMHNGHTSRTIGKLDNFVTCDFDRNRKCESHYWVSHLRPREANM